MASCGSINLPLEVSSETTFSELARTLAQRPAYGVSRHDMWFQHGGRRCCEARTLAEVGVGEGCVLHIHLRLRGGGGDGGATGAESRSSYLEMYMEKKPDKVNPVEEKLARWTTCKLSGEKLEPPCVVDELGNLYNKDAVVTALMAKSIPKALAHISSLKHVTDAKLTCIGSSTATAEVTSRSFQPGNEAAFCCPISGQPLNGQYRFYVVLPTGHVVSEKAVKQVPTAVEEHTGTKWADMIPLNGTQEEVEALWDKLIAKRAAAKKSKKDSRKADKALAATGGHAGNGEATAAGVKSRSSSGDSSSERIDTVVGSKRPVQDFTVQASAKAKKVKAADLAPAHADKKVWGSLFTSTHGAPTQETYSCRSTSARGWV